jgi:hypothetical protein
MQQRLTVQRLPVKSLLRACTAALLFLLTLLPGAALHAQSAGISSPAPGAAIVGDVPIIGSAVIDSFQKYELHYKQEPSGDDAYIYFTGGTTPIVGGQLGVWAAGGLPPGNYSIRLRVVKQDGNYAEYFSPNLSVNQAAPTPTPTETPSETATPTATFTPAAQPTPVIGQVAQPVVEDDNAPTPTPAVVAEGSALLPTPTPLNGGDALALAQSNAAAAPAEEGSLTRQLGEALSVDRLQTQFFSGVRLSAALFIGFFAIYAGKRLFEWAWRRYM